MSDTSQSSGRDTQDSFTDRVHETSWSANLEKPRHADSKEQILEDAVAAVQHTAPENHVNLVTHGSYGHPSTYLYEQLEEAFGGRQVSWEYIDECGCGGHVTRVHVGSTDT